MSEEALDLQTNESFHRKYIFTNELLGEGEFGKVFKVKKRYQQNMTLNRMSTSIISTLDNQQQTSISEVNEYAVKVVPKKRLDQNMVTNIREEIKILACLDHPNIVKFIEEFET